MRSPFGPSAIEAAFCDAELNYDTTEREYLYVVWAVLLLRQSLKLDEYLIRTDHASLCWVLILTTATAGLARWRLRLL